MDSRENKFCDREEAHVKRNTMPVMDKKVEPLNFIREESVTKTKVLDIPVDKLLTRDVSSMARESPDGSSDNTEWQTTCSASHPPMVPRNKSSQNPKISSTTISRLVHGKNIQSIVNNTGARPKEKLTPPKQSEEEIAGIQFLNIIDNGSGPGSSISPSLLQVNYSGECTTSDGDSSSAYCRQKSSRPTPRVPQPRHRASSGRLITFLADSDQESGDNASESSVQVSRRRKRTMSCQQHIDVSVKSLVDSRGVLESDSHLPGNASTDYVRSISEQFGDIDNLKPTINHLVSSLPSDSASDVPMISASHTAVSHVPPTTSTTPVVSISNVPHVMSVPVIASHPSDSADGIAFSAPEKEIKIGVLPSEAVKGKKKSHGRSRSDGSEELFGKVRLTQSTTVPYLEAELDSSKLFSASGDLGMSVPSQMRKRFMEDGGHSITPAADNGFFPRPEPGQSLIGFLSSKEFHKPYAELDRENAHFKISEAVIAALTQMQFDSWQQKFSSSPGTADESDEEIRCLQARIREKRRQKLSNSLRSPSISTATVTGSPEPSQWACHAPVRVESTTDYSVCESPQSSAYNSESDIVSEVEEEEDAAAAEDDSSSCEDSGRSCGNEKASSITSEVPLTTAENVALNLLKHFSEQRLPQACELEWLVSEQDVPQKLLPLPTSVAVSPDDAGAAKCVVQSLSQLRGTTEWAPPRPQLIFTLHTNTKRSQVMGTQGWRCAGCGMRVTERLSRHFRLCNYLGRYFCTTCHNNRTAVIPARVLHKWDFKLYPVANFSSELLKSMRSDPLFNVAVLNPGLYKRCRHLNQIHIYRLQLCHTSPYINTCSRAKSEKEMLGRTPPHWAADPHAYSLDDLIAAKGGQMVEDVKKLTTLCIKHVAKCQVCAGRGFICEVCGQGDPIFPFQLASTALCSKCNACFHAGCFSPIRCPRCIRRETRRFSEDEIHRNNI